MNSQLAKRLLHNAPDWVDSVCNCSDAATKRLVLHACAKVVLPYWESRFYQDDSMTSVVKCMANATSDPSTEVVGVLKAAIPHRTRRNWDLSPPPGFFDDDRSDCPADFAGDSIYYAASAFVSPCDTHDDRYAFATARECIARTLAERDGGDDDSVDYVGMADEYLRNKLLAMLN